MFGENQSAQALTPTSSRTEAFLKGAGVALGLGLFLSLPVDRYVSHTDHHPSNRPQDPRWSRSAHSALVFPQRNIQAMVQAAFDNPIASFDGLHPLGLEFFQSKAAHHENHFTGPFTLALDARLQPSCQPGSRKARL